MDYYEILTLDAAVILAEGKKTEDGSSYRFELDLNDPMLRERAVIKVENQADCALFRQIRIAAGKNDDSDPRTLIGDLIYLDFENVFKDRINSRNPLHEILEEEKSTDEIKHVIDARGEALMDTGLYIKMKGEVKTRQFYPFDKSGSMSRTGRISFIYSELYKNVDERIRMGMDFSRIDVTPSKYYSYRGLYMTDGRLINSLKLNNETVIVIADDKIEVSADIVTCDIKTDEKGAPVLNDDGKLPLIGEDGSLKLYHGQIKVNNFDGEGIISEAYAEAINDELFGKREVRSYSFQIRMPFVKGMLHKVDFKSFVKEQLGLKNLDGVMITDIYGKPRELEKAEIILAESMFKGAGWIRQEAENLGECDEMELYFQRFRDYDHALYISNTSMSFGGVDEVRMNYQFLNTLAMERDELKTLLEKHYSEARELPHNQEKAIKALLRRKEQQSDIEDDICDEEGLDLPAWKYALLQNPAFIYEPYIEKRLWNMSKSMTNNGLLGRINTRGAIGFLSGDLLSFMKHVLKQIKGKNTYASIEKLEDQRLGEDCFFMPGYENYGFNEANYYGILRNPHLSRNEQCALRPFCPDKDSLYERYFGDLTGVIMVPYGSIVPAVLGGADFDGDLVKVFTEEIINDAILRGAYTKVETPDGIRYERKYAVAEIPDIPSLIVKKENVTGMISFEQLRSTFSNKVGHISNASLLISKREYLNDSDKLRNLSALCTIAVGLEIDSVKTGVRPDLSIIDYLKGDEGDPFLSNKYKVDHGFFKNSNKKIKEKLDGSITPETKGVRPIDLLEYYYLEELDNDRRPEEDVLMARNEARKNMFNVEICHEAMIGEDKDLVEKLSKICEAYRLFDHKLHEIRRKIERIKKQTYKTHIRRLLYTEYDKSVDCLPLSGADIDEAIDRTISECEMQFRDFKEAESACDKLRTNWEDWIFAGDQKERERILADILDISKLSAESLEVLCNAYDNGYHILKFVLKHNNAELQAEQKYMDLKKKLLNDRKQGKYAEDKYDIELYNELCRDYDFKRTDAEWKEEVKEKCRRKIGELFEGDMVDAAEVYLRGSDAFDGNRMLFWEWFGTEEIQPLITHQALNAGSEDHNA